MGVSFRHVLVSREMLEVPWDMQAADAIATERHDVVDVVVRWAGGVDVLDLVVVLNSQPLRAGLLALSPPAS